MMENPSVSVVIPTVNFGAQFQEAVTSALINIDLKVEVVVVADGVTGDDPEVLSDPRVVVVRFASRRGTPYALNAGLACARGEYVARLDADDVAHADRLVAQKSYLANHPGIAVVGSRANLIDDEGTVIGSWGQGMPENVVRRTLVRRNPLIHSSVMYRRAEVLAAGGYSIDCLRMQDYELFLRLATLGCGFAVLDQKLVDYRIHEGQHSRNSPPWGSGPRLIQRRRNELAQTLGHGASRRFLNRSIWFVAQVTRHVGLRRARHLQGSR